MNKFTLLIPACLLLVGTPLYATELMIFPADGQSAEQQKSDEGECHVWAVDNSGVDPVALASETAEQQSDLAQQASEPAAQTQQRRGGVVKGAAAGAVVGEIADDDAGKGAAYGAAAGGISQRRRNNKSQQQAVEQQQQAQLQTATQQQELADAQKAQLDVYNRAYSACLTGKGYTVN